MGEIDNPTAYRRGWDRCRYYDDSAEDFEKCRARFAAKYGGRCLAAWEEGWSDAASTPVEGR